MAAPTVEKLNGLTKEQLSKVVEHFNFEVGVIKNIKLKVFHDLVKDKLVEGMTVFNCI